MDKDWPECLKRPYQKSSNFRQGATLMDILQQTDSTKKKSRRRELADEVFEEGGEASQINLEG